MRTIQIKRLKKGDHKNLTATTTTKTIPKSGQKKYV